MAVAALVFLAGVDAAVILGRLKKVSVDLPTSGPGTTFVLIGSDSRTFVASGTDRRSFGDAATVPGTRADLVFVLHIPDRGPPALLAVPRDLVVFSAGGAPIRLALTAESGLQGLVDALCGSLGIAADHVVLMDFSAFRQVVDVLGGVVVDVPRPIRDRRAGLDLGTAGPQHLDGADALAYVRSRQGEIHQGGGWVPEPDGAAERVTRAGAVLRDVASALPDETGSPLQMHRVAWVLAGALTVDTGTGFADLVRLARALHEIALTPGAEFTLPTTSLVNRGPLALGRWPPIPPRPSRLLTTEALPALEAVGGRAVPFPHAPCSARLLRQNWIVDPAQVSAPASPP